LIAFASNTQGKRNLDALRGAGFGILLTPGKHRNPPDWCDLYAIDNGCWALRDNPDAFMGKEFEELCRTHGTKAHFVVVPDKVARGKESLEFSVQWLPFCMHFRRPLLAVQDGMKTEDVGAILERYPSLGIFLGGSTEWKLSTLYKWGVVAHAFRRYFHVGRVNTAKRIRLCAEAGADSFDGTSATVFSCTIPLLNRARQQPSLLTPSATGARI
jgi:hypothetical protein